MFSLRMGVIVFNSTFNNISAISWQTVLVEEIGVPRENHRPRRPRLFSLKMNTKCICQMAFHERGRLFRYRMVVFHLRLQWVLITTTVVSSNPGHGQVYSKQHYVIKFVSDLRKIDCDLFFFSDTLDSFINTTDLHDITDILLKAT